MLLVYMFRLYVSNFNSTHIYVFMYCNGIPSLFEIEANIQHILAQSYKRSSASPNFNNNILSPS